MSVCRFCGVPLISGENWPKQCEKNHYHICSDCARIQNRERTRRYRMENPIKFQTYRRSYYDRNREKILAYYHERRIKQGQKPRENPLCSILRSHAEQLKADPERLTTDFLKGLIGIPARTCLETEEES